MIPGPDVNAMLNRTEPKKRTIRSSYHLLQAIQDVIMGNALTPTNHWKYYYASKIVEKLKIPIEDVLLNYNAIVLRGTQELALLEWRDRSNPNLLYKNDRFLKDVIDALQSLDKISIQLDRVILRIYNYNIRVTEDKVKSIESFIEQELQLLSESVGIKYDDLLHADTETIHNVLFGNSIHCVLPAGSGASGMVPAASKPAASTSTPAASTTDVSMSSSSESSEASEPSEVLEKPLPYRLDCSKSLEGKTPLLENDGMWQLYCGENKQYPQLLIEQVKNIVKRVDDFRVNNYSDSTGFITAIKELKAELDKILIMFWEYLDLPNVTYDILSVQPALRPQFATSIYDSYNTMVRLAESNNKKLYDMFFKKYRELDTFMEIYFIEGNSDKDIPIAFIEYAVLIYASAVSPQGNTRVSNNNSGAIIYFNGEKTSRKKINQSHWAMDSIVKLIEKKNSIAAPVWDRKHFFVK